MENKKCSILSLPCCARSSKFHLEYAFKHSHNGVYFLFVSSLSSSDFFEVNTQCRYGCFQVYSCPCCKEVVVPIKIFSSWREVFLKVFLPFLCLWNVYHFPFLKDDVDVFLVFRQVVFVSNSHGNAAHEV